jgi:hypothetical protein
MKFEKCICVPFESKGSNLFEWFINQDHIPFDMSSDAHGMYYTMYQDFLEEIEKKYTETGDNYYWFTKTGRLVSDEGREDISSNNIRVDKSKVREWKLSQILN